MPPKDAADLTLDPPAGDTDGDPGADPNASPKPDPVTEPTGDQPDAAELQVQLDAVQAELVKAKKESSDWLARFTGMQGKYQQEKKKWDEAAGDLSGLPTQLSDLQTQMDSLQTKYDDGQVQLAAAQREKELTDLSLERKNIIFKEFPGLISFEGDGLLPEGTGDDLRTKLGAFNDKMTKIGGDQFETLLSGSSVIKPKADDPGAKSVLDEALQAYNKGDMALYDTLYGKHLQQLDNGKE